VLAQQRHGDRKCPKAHSAPVVAVVPITHSPHRNRKAAIEIPAAIKRHLGLDDLPSWFDVDEFNVFTWPGFDLRPVPG
jgi:hypothetical protein